MIKFLIDCFEWGVNSTKHVQFSADDNTSIKIKNKKKSVRNSNYFSECIKSLLRVTCHFFFSSVTLLQMT